MKKKVVKRQLTVGIDLLSLDRGLVCLKTGKVIPPPQTPAKGAKK